MLAVRYVTLVALVVWVGGMVVLGGVVAPATFRILMQRRVGHGESVVMQHRHELLNKLVA